LQEPVRESAVTFGAFKSKFVCEFIRATCRQQHSVLSIELPSTAQLCGACLLGLNALPCFGEGLRVSYEAFLRPLGRINARNASHGTFTASRGSSRMTTVKDERGNQALVDHLFDQMCDLDVGQIAGFLASDIHRHKRLVQPRLSFGIRIRRGWSATGARR